LKGTRRHVDIVKFATGTTIFDLERNGFALEIDLNHSAADRVIVGIDTVVTGEMVKQVFRNSTDEICINVVDATSTLASLKECAITLERS